MEEFIEVRVSTGSLDEARRICRYLVQNRLVACAQIIPWIESIYMWNNQLETSQESHLSLKTKRECLADVEKVILENTTYEVPEILVFPITGGGKVYLDWVKESCMKSPTQTSS